MIEFIKDKKIEEVLLLNGYIEAPAKDRREINEGKKRFVPGPKSRLEIFIGKNMLYVLYKNKTYLTTSFLTKEEIIMMLFFCTIIKNNPLRYELIQQNNNIDLKNALDRIPQIKNEIVLLEKIDNRHKRVKMLIRLIKAWDDFEVKFP